MSNFRCKHSVKPKENGAKKNVAHMKMNLILNYQAPKRETLKMKMTKPEVVIVGNLCQKAI